MKESIITGVLSLFGILICLGSAIGFASPKRLSEWVIALWGRAWAFPLAIGVRLVLGVLLISGAPQTKYPQVFQILGFLAIIGAMVILIAGRKRIGRLLVWWKRFPPLILRLLMGVGIAFGGFILYGVI